MKNILEEYLLTASPAVSKHVEVITPEDVGQDFLLHISKDFKIKKFIPVIGHRQANSEDRTMPRVCVCDTLLGCAIGYSATTADFLSSYEYGGKEAKKSGYLGGYKIYAIPFQAALKPDTKLVYDANASNEVWLVSYSAETRAYAHITAGELFISGLNFSGRSGKLPEESITIFVNVVLDTGLKYSKNIMLAKGHHRIESFSPDFTEDWKDDKKITVTPISAGDYNKAKSNATEMVALEAESPLWIKW